MWAGIRIDRDSGALLHAQIRDQIIGLVRTGRLPAGSRLPAERELARRLGVSRNTVALAYRWLEREGRITSWQGRGTFVCPGGNGDTRQRLVAHIDSSFQQALADGLSADEFLTLVQERIAAHDRVTRKVRVVFIECNREQLDYFARELQLGAGVAIVPVLLDEAMRRPERARPVLEAADLVVTTFFHLDDVNALLPPGKGPAVGIALDPQLDTVVRIARLPRDGNVGLVCISRAFADRVQRSVANAGIELQLDVTTSRDRAELEAFLRGRRAVIASPGRRREVELLAGPGVTVIEFVYRPDAGSVNLLKSVVWELHRKLQQGSGPGASGPETLED